MGSDASSRFSLGNDENLERLQIQQKILSKIKNLTQPNVAQGSIITQGSSYHDSDSGFEVQDFAMDENVSNIAPLRPISKNLSSYKPSDMFFNQNTADDQLDAFLNILDDIEAYNNCDDKPDLAEENAQESHQRVMKNDLYHVLKLRLILLQKKDLII